MKRKSIITAVLGASCWLAGCARADFDPTLGSELEAMEPEIGTLEQPLCETRAAPTR